MLKRMDLAECGGTLHDAHAKWLDLIVQALQKRSLKNGAVLFVYEKTEHL